MYLFFYNFKKNHDNFVLKKRLDLLDDPAKPNLRLVSHIIEAKCTTKHVFIFILKKSVFYLLT
jgi:hypothetical protein